MRKPLVIFLAASMLEVASATGSETIASDPDLLMVLVAVVAPFAASLMVAGFYRYFGDYSAYLGAFSGLISFSAVLSLLGTKGSVSIPWIPSLGVSFEFYVDGLSILIALLASGIGVLVFVYSRKYMEHENRKRKYYTVLTAFMGSMVGLVFSSNMVLMFLFWEFTSICSFLLISHDQRTISAINSSRKSLLITVGSGLLLLLGFILLGDELGTYSIAEILSMNDVTGALVSENLYLPVLLLLGLGAGAKSAQVPLHIWLPDAMEAPTPVSAFLHSATMVKAGVFLLGRFRPVLMQGETWNTFLLFLGFLTMMVGALLAFKSTELKELLAYSTASHLGLIVAGFGFPGLLGAETASFHIFNHAVFKASLFMVAGVMLHETGTQKIKDISGLGKNWPVLRVVATVSGLSMAGLPLLNGFYSKELLYKSSYDLAVSSAGLAWLIPVLAVSASIFTFLYSLKFISVFYGQKTFDLHSPQFLMTVPPALLSLVVVLVGLSPETVVDYLVSPALHSISIGRHDMAVHVLPGLTPPFLMSILTLVIGASLFLKRESVQRRIGFLDECKYVKANFYYNAVLDRSYRLSDLVVENVETGLLRTYVIWVLVVASVSGLAGYYISGVLPSVFISTQLPVIVVLGTSVAAVYAVMRSDTYLSSVLTLSILGFMVSIFYLLMDAPDLVMTQLVVESLSLVIFLLVLDKIPEYTKNISFSRKYRDLLISGSAGLLVSMSVLYSTMEETPERLAEYYIENALPGSGGTNVVNVILVDFRGLDTMGEISVVVMAGLAILMLFRMRGDEE